MLVLIIITIILFILLISELQINIHNIKNINYVKVKLLIFKMDLDYSQFMKTLKRLGFENDIDLKEQRMLIKTINPIMKDLAKQTVITNLTLYKFFDEYSKTYKVITYYLLSSYLNSLLEFNFKKLKKYNYEVLYSKTREDIDFNLICNIRIYNIFYAVIKNIKVVFNYFKRRIVNGSWIKYLIEGKFRTY